MEGFDAGSFVERQIGEIKGIVGDQKAICALSGGVDSAAVAVLAHRAIGDNLRCVFLDDGLMRQGEGEKVKSDFAQLGINVDIEDVADEFFQELRGKEDPEEKRKAFRNIFYTVLGRIVRESGAKFMMQGTIAADIKETKGGIKTQHNVLEQIGVDPDSWGLERVLEPLIELYKPEVRLVAKELGLPEDRYNRMPFPGPGLSARVIGEVTPERTATVRKATSIVEEEFKDSDAFQYFAVLLNDKSTGMTPEGERRFGQIVVVRSVDSKDALTAKPTEITWGKMMRLQERITSEVPGVVKVLYDLSGKPPSTIEYI